MIKHGYTRTIIIITAIALIGLITTQTIWIVKAIRVGTEQINHRANITLEDVLDELMIYAADLDSLHSNDSLPTKWKEPDNLFGVLDTTVLDTLMKKYISYHKLSKNYGYQIVKTANDSVIYSPKKNLKRPKSTIIHRACLSCLWTDEYFHIALFFPNQSKRILLEMSVWLIVSAIFLLTIILTFAFTLRNLFLQKRVSEIKNDFINNMTHEFKTPLSTISLASEVLKTSGENKERTLKYASIIHEENTRLQSQVDRILQVAQLERDEIILNTEPVFINQLIKETVHNLCLEQCGKEVVMHYDLNAKNTEIEADKLHLTNMIINLVDNAIKHSGPKPDITISTHLNKENEVMNISVADNGPGIPEKRIQQIFERFYRIPTGNIHNVRGFGLGLYYVKTMIRAHNGDVYVKSSGNAGSTFTLEIPVKQNQS